MTGCHSDWRQSFMGTNALKPKINPTRVPIEVKRVPRAFTSAIGRATFTTCFARPREALLSSWYAPRGPRGWGWPAHDCRSDAADQGEGDARGSSSRCERGGFGSDGEGEGSPPAGKSSGRQTEGIPASKIFAVPAGRIRFCWLNAFTTSAGEIPFDWSRAGFRSIITCRCFPP